MKLRGIDFGPVLDASGVRGFFGEGYWYHRWLRPFGLDFTGSTFVAKTTTLYHRAGNMMLDFDLIPVELKPKCIKVYFRKKMVLNAVGLSGPGAKELLEDGRWQERDQPFFLSFMSVAKTADERLEELRLFVQLLQRRHFRFKAKIGLQINFSCPNVAVHQNDLVKEVKESLFVARALDVPLMPKFNLLLTVHQAKEIADDPNCDALCLFNTIPWRGHPGIDWDGLFGVQESPLAEFGGGGLSGEPLMPLVRKWLGAAKLHIAKPINVGGGISHERDVDALHERGAASIFIGSVAMYRSWRVQSIIRRAHEVFAKGGC